MDIKFAVDAEIKPAELVNLFRQTDWASGRLPEGVARMIEHTTLHVSAWHAGRLVGFVRAITDMIYRAVIDDLVVDKAYRGRTIGSQLMERLGKELADVEEVFFSCDASVVPFYEKHGYEQTDTAYMKRSRRNR